MLGQARYGVYKDECEGVHPDAINKYYGVHGNTVHRRGTGAGHPIDEEDGDVEAQPELAERIAQDQQSQIRHEGVAVPQHGNPFTKASAEDQFWRVLREVVQDNVVPGGVGLYLEEWEGGVYPSYEVVRVGNRGTREIQVSLSDPIWQQRAKLWGQALTVLSITQMQS